MAPTFENFVLAEQVATTKGARICALACDGASVRVTFASRVRTPFGPGTFDKTVYSTRQSLQLSCGSEMEEYFEEFDAWSVEYLAENAERIFKKPMTRDQIVDGFKPTLTRKGSYPALLRTKINVEGVRPCRYWDENGAPREAPQDWRAVELVPSLVLRHVWKMGKDMGWVIECTDLQVFESKATCPFVGGLGGVKSVRSLQRVEGDGLEQA